MVSIAAVAERKPRPWMRVQLQRDREHYDSQQMFTGDPNIGVTVAQAVAGVRAMASSPKLPKSEKNRAQRALDQAVRWISTRPPAGWAGRVAQTFELDPTNAYEGFRIDIENLHGHNLR